MSIAVSTVSIIILIGVFKTVLVNKDIFCSPMTVIIVKFYCITYNFVLLTGTLLKYANI